MNGYRDYSEHDLRLVREIRSHSALGISAQGTRPFLECLTFGHEHGDDCPASLAQYREAIDGQSHRIDGLTRRRQALIARLHQPGRPPGVGRHQQPARRP